MRSLISGLQAASFDAADGGAHVRRPAAEKRGHVDPAGDGEIGAHAKPGPREGDDVARAHADRLPHRQRVAVERRAEVAAGDGDDVVGGRAQLAAEEEDLEAGIARIAANQVAAAGVVADEEIGDPQREAVEGARGGHAGVEIAGPAQVLDRRLRPAARSPRTSGDPRLDRLETRQVVVERVFALLRCRSDTRPARPDGGSRGTRLRRSGRSGAARRRSGSTGLSRKTSLRCSGS